MGKVVENMNCGTVKLEFCCSGYRVQKAIDSLRGYIVCRQHMILLMALCSSDNLNLCVT